MHLWIFQVLWHTGIQTWVRDEKLPEHLRNSNRKVSTIEKNYFGQPTKFLDIKNISADEKNEQQVKSSNIEKESEGFSKTSFENTTVNDEGKKRQLKCHTEKAKHKSKNKRSADQQFI